jgi:hypothetical protein
MQYVKQAIACEQHRRLAMLSVIEPRLSMLSVKL